MNQNHLYIDSFYKAKIQADANAATFSINNKQQYYHIIPLDEGSYKVSRYYDEHSIGCYYNGVYQSIK